MLVPYTYNALGLRGHVQMSCVCEKDRLCRKVIRQWRRKATEPRLVHNIFAIEERQLFPTMTCAVPDFLADRSLRWVDAMGCKTVKVGGN